MEEKILKGTTTIGLVCSDGVVLATDRRASYGHFIASKTAKKAFNINNKVAATVAGSVGDAESLMRLIQAEAALYEINNGESMQARSVSSLLSNILQGSRVFPYLVQLIIAGQDGKKYALFTLDPIGGLIEETYASTGSGSPMAYGILERDFKENTPVEKNLVIALHALAAALARDSGTGDGMDLYSITEAGFKQYSDEEVKKILDAAK
ncbi:Proteasome subunit beta [uncultured archaeon]|nr:Proteasome subunit beta [uncultured archaeon]